MKIVALQDFPAVDELIERFGARHLPFVLDSSLSNDGLGEWSFFGADPFLVFEGKDGSYVERRRRSAGDGEATLNVEHSIWIVIGLLEMAKYPRVAMVWCCCAS